MVSGFAIRDSIQFPCVHVVVEFKTKPGMTEHRNQFIGYECIHFYYLLLLFFKLNNLKKKKKKNPLEKEKKAEFRREK